MNKIQTEEFVCGLKEFDMHSAPGFVLVDAEPNDYYQRIALENAKKYGAAAVYFRLFDNGRPPLPQVYIYDFTKVEKDEDTIAELHRRLWNSGQVPLLFIFDKTDVKIFNCFKQPDIKDGEIVYSPLETIRLAGEIQDKLKISEFSPRNFDNGAFWETSSYKDHFKLSERAYEKLLEHLIKVRKEKLEENILPANLTHRLLVLTILVKYLDERKDENGHRVFPQDFFSQFAKGATTFAEVLRKKGACLRLCSIT